MLRRRLIHIILAIFGSAFLFPAVVFADAVWQAMFFSTDILRHTWWVIPVGLAIEYPVVHWILKQSAARAFVANIAMNVASFFLAGLLETPALFLEGGGRAALMFSIATILNTIIEGCVLHLFKPGIFNRGTLFTLLFANATSIGLAMIVLWR